MNYRFAFFGKKQAGKNTACNFLIVSYLNKILNEKVFSLDNNGAIVKIDQTGFKQIDTEQLFIENKIKLVSFADKLKYFLIDVFNVPYESCFGSDFDKNKPIPHLKWESFHSERKGDISARQLMQHLGTDICRKIWFDCWAFSAVNSINNDKNNKFSEQK